MTAAQRKELDAMREWARVGLALYTGAMGAIALFYPDQSQVPLNQSYRPEQQGE